MDDEPNVIGPAAPMPTLMELCDSLHHEEEGNETQAIPTRDLLAITSLLEAHPVWWDYPCFCAECRSYCNDDDGVVQGSAQPQGNNDGKA